MKKFQSLLMQYKFVLCFLFLGSLSAGMAEPAIEDFTQRLQVEDLGKFNCKETGTKNQSKRYECPITDKKTGTTKIFYVAHFKSRTKADSLPEITYDHGYLFAKELNSENGLARFVKRQVEAQLKASNQAVSKAKEYLLNCVVHHVNQSVSKEFSKAIVTLHQGYLDRLKELKIAPKFSLLDFIRAAYGIELGNILDSILYQFTKKRTGSFWQDLKLKKALAQKLLNACSKPIVRNIATDFLGISTFSSKAEVFRNILMKLGNGQLNPLKMGCVGFVSPKSTSKGNKLVHARALDGDMLEAWNNYPALFIMQEKGYLKYVAAGTLGLFYAGGISGFNEKGISLSLHQMYSSVFRILFDKEDNAEMFPYTQQRVLREADSSKSLKRLYGVDGDPNNKVKIKNFASWTSLASDVMSHEAYSIEGSSRRSFLARATKNKPLGQSNHFIAKEMIHDAYVPNLNKWLESRSRLQVVESAVKAAKNTIDEDWAIRQLASHRVALGKYRYFESFGKGAVKAYALMMTVVKLEAVPNQNKLKESEIWISLGDKHPPQHGMYVGFKVNLEDGASFEPITYKQIVWPRRLENWQKSLGLYVQARVDYRAGKYQQALAGLDKAVDKAESDKVKEMPYYFMRARLLDKMARELGKKTLPDASKDWEKLLSLPEESYVPYQLALVKMYSVASDDALGKEAKLTEKEREARLFEAIETLQAYYGDDKAEYHKHFDLRKKLLLAWNIYNKKTYSLPGLDFVVVE